MSTVTLESTITCPNC
ncbi:MAG: hypothetical protein ACQER4_02570, partial [Bacteroidota bacterium]